MTARLIRRCEYCGTILPKDADKCPGCHSMKWKEEVVDDGAVETPQPANAAQAHAFSLPLIICLCVFALAISAIAIVALNGHHESPYEPPRTNVNANANRNANTNTNTNANVNYNRNTTPPRTVQPAMSYDRSVNGDGTELKDYKNGYYIFTDTPYYCYNGRWFTFPYNASTYGWEYERMVPAALGNDADAYFSSENYRQWYADEYGAGDIQDTGFFK